MNTRQIILASTSPRRIEILKKAGLDFAVVAPEYEEDMTLAMPPLELVQHLAQGKAQSVVSKYPGAIIIAADTFVVLHGKIYGKPGTPARAKEMLSELSGQMHEVMTGFTVLDTNSGRALTDADITKVYVKQLTSAQIDEYVATGEPLNKAGAYAIQSDGKTFIEKYEGDYLTILGLPVEKVLKSIREILSS